MSRQQLRQRRRVAQHDAPPPSASRSPSPLPPHPTLGTTNFSSLNVGSLATLIVVVGLVVAFCASPSSLPPPLPMLRFPVGTTPDELEDHNFRGEGPAVPASAVWATGKFSEGNARVHLHAMAGLGPKLLGSDAAEIHTLAYILDALDKVPVSPAVRLEVDVQTASGDFFLDFITGFASVYHNVTNVLVRLELADPDTSDADRGSFLLSTHYDSALHSPAASDALAGVSIMLELIRVIAEYPDDLQAAGILRTPLVFNLNGAEESLLQGSHAFITQHPWAQHLIGFLNVEAAGSGGRDLVFQTGTGWLAKAYAQGAHYPYGNSVGQDVFQSGVIPSDTDFRIYRDFGALPGIDMAYIENGYVYHTPLDQETFVTHGSLQRGGENILGTLAVLAAQYGDQDARDKEEDAVVYFDLLNTVMVAYSLPTARIINTSLVVLWAYVVLSKAVAAAQTPGALTLPGWLSLTAKLTAMTVLTVLAPIGVGVLLWLSAPLLGSQMVWFALPSLLIPVYFFVAAAVNLALGVLLFARQAPGVTALDCSTGSWVFLLIVLTVLDKGSSYLPALWVGGLVGPELTMKLLPGMTRLSSTRWLVLHLVWVSVPLLLTVSLFRDLFAFFIPLMGRAGTVVPADIVMGLFIGVPTAVISTVLSLLLLKARSVRTQGRGKKEKSEARRHKMISSRTLILVLLAVSGLTLIVVFPRVAPYTQLRPKRMFIQHVLGTDPEGPTNALWVNVMDSNSVSWVFDRVPELSDIAARAQPIECPSHRFYCAPWYLPVADMVSGGYLVPAEPIEYLADPEDVSIVRVEETDGNVRYLIDFPAATTHVTMTIDVPTSRQLLSWSISDPIPPKPEHGGYFFYLTSAVGGSVRARSASREMHIFHLEVVFSPGTDPLYFGISFHSQAHTAAIAEFESRLPEWVTPVSWVSQHVRREA